ncbi:MAG: hypothetical protein A3K19_29525 [Lentisphaerae bacterium RIFOXYB12_FULL_65_16]|nr:MAG: hypothetical protein A3K18_03825 [Lentisphaerae bacterium RIFOXYA12_64_32]OGV92988.1 MAG: hypothetical protein A3K19_29525 [Lentisphaerae bacterium RIFOXYB12_FULL_65_16]
MKLTILGSAAAEAWPALFCECAACAEARRRGGRNIRRRTAYWINRDTLVDFGPDICSQSLQFGIDLAEIRQIFVTHSHQDHFAPVELFWRRKGFSVVTRPLTLYANPKSYERLRAEGSGFFPAFFKDIRLLEDLKVHEEVMLPGRTVNAGSLKVTALAASHGDAQEQAMNYVIEEDGKAALIGNDTGWWADPTWEQVRQFKLDVVLLDCTYVHRAPEERRGHLGALATVAVRDRLAELGVLKPGAQVIVNHFSHNGLTLHEELCEFFRPHGMAVGYDGMVIEA